MDLSHRKGTFTLWTGSIYTVNVPLQYRQGRPYIKAEHGLVLKT